MQTQSYRIMVKVKIDCDVSIKATSLKDALEKAETMKPQDFIEAKGEIMDEGMHIIGLFEE